MERRLDLCDRADCLDVEAARRLARHGEAPVLQCLLYHRHARSGHPELGPELSGRKVMLVSRVALADDS